MTIKDECRCVQGARLAATGWCLLWNPRIHTEAAESKARCMQTDRKEKIFAWRVTQADFLLKQWAVKRGFQATPTPRFRHESQVTRIFLPEPSQMKSYLIRYYMEGGWW